MKDNSLRADSLTSAINTVDAATTAADEARRSEQEAADAHQASLRREYLEILCRSVRSKVGDDARLAAIIMELGLKTSDVKQTAARIAEAEAQLAIIAAEGNTLAALESANANIKEIKARHKRELNHAEAISRQARFNHKRPIGRKIN